MFGQDPMLMERLSRIDYQNDDKCNLGIQLHSFALFFIQVIIEINSYLPMQGLHSQGSCFLILSADVGGRGRAPARDDGAAVLRVELPLGAKKACSHRHRKLVSIILLGVPCCRQRKESFDGTRGIVC